MSFILDALRKSDSERQQQKAPGIASTVQRRETRRPNVWIPLLIVVLALNAAVVGWLLLREEQPTGNDAHPETSGTTRSLRKESAAAPASGGRATPVETAAGNPAEVVAVPPVPPAAKQTARQEPTPSAPVAAKPAARAARATSEAELPRFEQLLMAGVISSPPLHLDIHVFAAAPDKRFVFINMKKYREGERLTEGPVLESITETGVILTQNGNRFTLERN